MSSRRAIAAVTLAIGLLFVGTLGSDPDAIGDDDVQQSSIDLCLVELGFSAPAEPSPAMPRQSPERARSTGREYSAAIFHPPI